MRVRDGDVLDSGRIDGLVEFVTPGGRIDEKRVPGAKQIRCGLPGRCPRRDWDRNTTTVLHTVHWQSSEENGAGRSGAGRGPFGIGTVRPTGVEAIGSPVAAAAD